MWFSEAISSILFSCLSVFADDEHGGTSGSFGDTETSVNMWQSSMWSYCFPNVEDFSEIFPDDNSLNLLTDHVEEFSSDEFQVIVVSPDSRSSVGISDMFNVFFCFGNARNETSRYLTYPDNYQDNHTDMGQYYSYITTDWRMQNLSTSSGSYYFSISLSNFIGPGYKCICNSLEWYNFMKSGQSYAAEQCLYYYPGNIVENFLEFVNSDNYYDVDEVSGNYIKYYSWFDSYKGKDNVSFYGENDIRNYLNSSVSFEDELYY